eukprot:PhF_6_TR28074/c0_g1_i2/m.41472
MALAHDQELFTVTTTAVNRDITHLDTTKWFAMLAASAYARYVIAHPFKVVMARKRTHRESLSSPEVIRSILREHGPRGLFRGVGVSAGGNACGEAFYVYFFEIWRQVMPFRSQ